MSDKPFTLYGRHGITGSNIADFKASSISRSPPIHALDMFEADRLLHVYKEQRKSENEVRAIRNTGDYLKPRDEVIKGFENEKNKFKRKPDVFIMPAAYPPSIKSLKALEKILLKEMTIGSRHTGKYVIAKILTNPHRLDSIMVIMEDEEEAAISMQLYFQENEENRYASELIKKGAFIAVKEPFLRNLGNSGYALRVDHVSDILWLEATDENIPARWRTEKNGWESENTGNLRQDLDACSCCCKAHRWYGEEDRVDRGLVEKNKTKPQPIGHFDQTLSNSLNSVDLWMTTEVNLISVATLYSLENYQECAKFAQVVVELNGSDDAEEWLCKAKLRIKERETGEYDYSIMYEALDRNQLYLDHASYTGLVEIRESRLGGEGLFLTKRVKAGDLLLCEKAFAVCFPQRNNVELFVNMEMENVRNGTTADLIAKIVDKLHKNPSYIRYFTSLYHGKYTSGKWDTVDGTQVVDTFFVERVIHFNAFGSPLTSRSGHYSHVFNATADGHDKTESNESSGSTGIWMLASKVNHACIGNCHRTFIGDMMIVRATQAMPAGTELVFPYVYPSNHDHDWGLTQRKLRRWDFECLCSVCKDALKHFNDRDLAKERAELKEKLESKIKMNELLSAPNPWLSTYGPRRFNPRLEHMDIIEVFLTKLEQTFLESRFVPQSGMIDQHLWLVRAYAKLGKPIKIIQSAVRALEFLGYDLRGTLGPKYVDGEDDGELKVYYGRVADCVIDYLMHMWCAYVMLNDMERAETSKQHALTTYKIIVGEDMTFDLAYGRGGRFRAEIRRPWDRLYREHVPVEFL